MKKTAIILFSVLLFTACNSASNQQDTKTTEATQDVHMKAEQQASPKFTADMVDNKKDFACGMPVTAGINDTLHYEGKVYGFCSKKCKDDFLKDPKGYLAKQ